MQEKNTHSTHTKRLRGRAGVKQRKRRLQRTNYLCEMCLAEDRTEAATVVNHKIPLTHDGPDTDENTENLCKQHDLEVTAKQFGYKKPRQAIGADGWPA